MQTHGFYAAESLLVTFTLIQTSSRVSPACSKLEHDRRSPRLGMCISSCVILRTSLLVVHQDVIQPCACACTVRRSQFTPAHIIVRHEGSNLRGVGFFHIPTLR